MAYLAPGPRARDAPEPQFSGAKHHFWLACRAMALGPSTHHLDTYTTRTGHPRAHASRGPPNVPCPNLQPRWHSHCQWASLPQTTPIAISVAKLLATPMQVMQGGERSSSSGQGSGARGTSDGWVGVCPSRGLRFRCTAPCRTSYDYPIVRRTDALRRVRTLWIPPTHSHHDQRAWSQPPSRSSPPTPPYARSLLPTPLG